MFIFAQLIEPAVLVPKGWQRPSWQVPVTVPPNDDLLDQKVKVNRFAVNTATGQGCVGFGARECLLNIFAEPNEFPWNAIPGHSHHGMLRGTCLPDWPLPGGPCCVDVSFRFKFVCHRQATAKACAV